MNITLDKLYQDKALLQHEKIGTSTELDSKFLNMFTWTNDGFLLEIVIWMGVFIYVY